MSREGESKGGEVDNMLAHWFGLAFIVKLIVYEFYNFIMCTHYFPVWFSCYSDCIMGIFQSDAANIQLVVIEHAVGSCILLAHRHSIICRGVNSIISCTTDEYFHSLYTVL